MIIIIMKYVQCLIKLNYNDWYFSLIKNYNSSNVLINKQLIPSRKFPATVPGTIHTDLLDSKIN